MNTRHVLLTVLLGLLSPWAMTPAQTPPEDDEVQKAPKDPYTDEDPELMAAAGYVGFGPFALCDFHSTADVERVVGRRVLWVETAHFKIGCSLGTVNLPTNQEQRKYITEELKRLRSKLPKVNPRSRSLDPWLRLHLYAQRAEEMYADFLQRLGVTDADFGKGKEPPNGPYLGMPDKYVLILFQKKGDLARFLERYSNVRNDISWRTYFLRSYQLGMMLAAEGFKDSAADDLAVWTHAAHGLTHNLVNGYRGYFFEMPTWFNEGLAHWYSRKIPTEFINVAVKDDDVVDQKEQHAWARKIRARASFDYFPKAEQMIGWKSLADMGFLAHLMAWSRVDYLMNHGDDGFGVFVKQMKSIPVPRDGIGVRPEQIDRMQRKLLQEIWDMDLEAFDTRWKAWVLKTYPKK